MKAAIAYLRVSTSEQNAALGNRPKPKSRVASRQLNLSIICHQSARPGGVR
jgi:DNA invertase Pin-like site-specific DNA recombinase